MKIVGRRAWVGRDHLLMAGALVVWVMVALAGCGDFEQRWQQATTQPAPPPPALEGLWEGTWENDADTKDSGSLRCIMTRREDGTYDAEFKATYWGSFNFATTVLMTAEWKGDRWIFRGQKDLGLFGTYEYDGFARGVEMVCRYVSSYEEGTFRLDRVGPAESHEP